MAPSVPLSQKIVELREVNNITQLQLAERMGVSRSLIGAWETGRSRPNEAQIRQLADIFVSTAQEEFSLVILSSLLRKEDPVDRLVGILLADDQRPESQRAVAFKAIQLDVIVRQVLEGGEEISSELSNVLHRGAFSRAVQEVKPITYHLDERVYEAVGEHHPLDGYAHEQFRKLIEQVFFEDQTRPGLVLFSEQKIDTEGVIEPLYLYPEGRSDPLAITEYVILDPLDRTAEAVRGIAGFASLTYGSFEHGPIFSVVFLLFDRTVSCYYAITDRGAWVRFHDGTEQIIAPSSTTDLKQACIAAYVGRSGRLKELAEFQELLHRHGLESTFVNASGCYGFCLVAASQADAFIEVVEAKGYRWHDIVSGAHILREAGGLVCDLSFDALRDPLEPTSLDNLPASAEDRIAAWRHAWSSVDPRTEGGRVGRQHFIAAASLNLGGKIAIALALKARKEPALP